MNIENFIYVYFVHDVSEKGLIVNNLLYNIWYYLIKKSILI